MGGRDRSACRPARGLSLLLRLHQTRIDPIAFWLLSTDDDFVRIFVFAVVLSDLQRFWLRWRRWEWRSIQMGTGVRRAGMNLVG